MLGVEAQEALARIRQRPPGQPAGQGAREVAAVVPSADKLRRLDWDHFAEHRSAIVDRWNKVVNR